MGLAQFTLFKGARGEHDLVTNGIFWVSFTERAASVAARTRAPTLRHEPHARNGAQDVNSIGRGPSIFACLSHHVALATRTWNVV